MKTRCALVCLLTLAAPAAAFAQSSWGVAAAPDGNIYFCDNNRTRVWKLTRAGKLSVALDGVSCHALVTGFDGAIYGEGETIDADTGSRLGVWRVKDPGLPQWWLARVTKPEPTEWLVTDRRGFIYAWNGAAGDTQASAITRRDPTAPDFTVFAGSTPGQRDGTGEDAQLGLVLGFAMAPDGTLVALDDGNIRRIDQNGSVTTEARHALTIDPPKITGRRGLWLHEMGVATDRDGAAVVVDPGSNRIVRVRRDGSTEVLWKSGGFANVVTGNRWGWRPTGVAMLGRTYYVLEEWKLPEFFADVVGSPRIYQVAEDGSTTEVIALSDWMVRGATIFAVLALVSGFFQWRRRVRATRRSTLEQFTNLTFS